MNQSFNQWCFRVFSGLCLADATVMMKSNKYFLFTFMRIFLIFSLLFPVAPAFASMANDGTSSSVIKHCSDKQQTLSSDLKAQLFAVVTAMKDHKNCEKACSTNSNCVCQSPCLQLSSSATPTLLNHLKIVSSLHGVRKSLFSDIDDHALNNLYLPALRPPIC